MKLMLAAVLCVAPAAFAQRVEDLPVGPVLTVVPATTIGPHHMGETLAEWLVAAPACIKHNEYSMRAPTCDDVSKVHDDRAGVLAIQQEHGFYMWFFADRAVSEVSIIPDGPEGIAVELGLLIQKYGTPAKNAVVTHQNLFGARWDGVEASWYMPDGTLITAGDTRNREGRQQLVIDFKSAAVVEKELRERLNKPNPY